MGDEYSVVAGGHAERGSVIGRGAAQVSEPTRLTPADEPDAPVRRTVADLSDSAFVALVAIVLLTLVDPGGGMGEASSLATLAVAGGTAWLVYVREGTASERRLLTAATAFAVFWTFAALHWGTGFSGARGLALGAVGLISVAVLAARMSAARGSDIVDWVVRGSATLASLAIVGYLARSSGWVERAGGMWRAAGTLAYANGFGLLLALLAPIAAIRATNGSSTADRRWGRVVVVLLAATLTLTMSRGAGVALAVGLMALPPACRRRAVVLSLIGAVAALPLLGTATSDHPTLLCIVPLVLALVPVAVAPSLTSRRTTAVLLAVCVSVVAGMGVWSGSLRDVVAGRLAVSSLDSRSPEWRAGFDQLTEAPLRGVGPERAVVLSDPRDGHEYWSRFLHNEYLQIAGGAGIAGVLLFSLLARRFVSLVRARPNAHVVATLLVFAVGGLLDFSWHFPAITMTTGLLVGLNHQERAS